MGECEAYKKERDVLDEEMREIDACWMEKFIALDNSGKTIAFLGDGGHKRQNRKELRQAFVLA